MLEGVEFDEPHGAAMGWPIVTSGILRRMVADIPCGCQVSRSGMSGMRMRKPRTLDVAATDVTVRRAGLLATAGMKIPTVPCSMANLFESVGASLCRRQVGRAGW